MVALVSGLSLRRPNSFARQLRELARALRAQGAEVLLVGRGAGGGEPAAAAGERDLPTLSATELARAGGPMPLEAAILLGYPDQFPLLGEPGPPCPLFLWAQCSRPPDPRLYGAATAVPLTETTRVFLVSAGVERVGPVIPHGVDVEVFRPPAAAGRRRFILGTVGANTPRKRLDCLLEGFALFARRRPGAQLRIKTDRPGGPAGGDLPALAERLGVSGRVRLETRELSEAAMADFYRQLDLFVTAAEWEGFCLPAVEAMACGRAVMSLPIQGAAEVVPYADLLVDRASLVREGPTVLRQVAPADLADALEAAAAAPAALEALGRQGRREALARYDIRRVASRWRELIGRRPTVRPTPR